MTTWSPTRVTGTLRRIDAAARAVADVEARQVDLDLVAVDRQQRVDPVEAQVPASLALLAVAEAGGAVGDLRAVGGQHDGLPLRVLAPLAEVGGGQEAAGDVRVAALAPASPAAADR